MDDYDDKRENFHMTDTLLLKLALTRAAEQEKKENAKILKKAFDRAIIHKKQSKAEEELLKLVTRSNGWGLKKTHKKHKKHKNYRKRTKYKRRTKYKKHKNYGKHKNFGKHTKYKKT